ncbi:sigma-54-dependent Fis family transcriptional regulator, partial [bacterium]|nr:sigma-54-dependent Fis family transcriptional regulator [bacterium]
SELFGHERGSFTGAFSRRAGRFEQAHHGTMFLDEIGDMSLATQAKVLRVIENKEFERIGGKDTIKVDVRIIAATNKDLVMESQQGRFREDLFYRLNVVSILLPPLRERKEDILLLTDYFLNKFNEKFGKEVTGFSFDAMSYFHEYSWPGNIREMQNVIESAVALSMDDTIDIGNLPYKLGDIKLTSSVENIVENRTTPIEPVEMMSELPVEVNHESMSLEDLIDQLINRNQSLDEVERLMIKQAMRRTDGIQKKAAKILGLGKGGIQYKLKKHGIVVSKVVN